MSEHRAVIEWSRDGADFGTRYDRSHHWSFDGGVVVPASSAPHLQGDPSRVDPEEAFVAAVSSCHMLWFLHLAAVAGHVVDTYRDDAVGTMTRTDTGTQWISRVDLHPVVDFAAPGPEPEDVEALHRESHRVCFIANSVRSAITVHSR
jgi:organic hydroperoxide reductase OsmC/OhrA